MAPPNEVMINSVPNGICTNPMKQSFQLSEGKLSVNGVTLHSDVPSNVSLGKFFLASEVSDVPLHLLQLVQSRSNNGGFLGFTQDKPSDRLINSLGKFHGRSFVSVFRFKAWWSTMWVGDSGSGLQNETRWVLLNVPEQGSYVLILPLIEGSFRSALNPGSDGDVLICAESGSSKVKASSFTLIAYVHVSENPFDLMREAFAAVRVLTFRLLEEKKPLPSLLDKFGWCTWDAFYLTVDPIGSINRDEDDPVEDAKNLVLGGDQMTARLHRKPATEQFDSAIDRLKEELGRMIESGKESSSIMGERSGSSEFTGLKSFVTDLRTKFKGLGDIYVWHALCGAWGGVRPGATHLDSRVVPVSVSPGLEGTMEDLAVVRIVEGGIGLVHPSQADDFYESMHSYLAESGITGVKVDVINTLEYVCEEYGVRAELAKAYYQGLTKSLTKNFEGSGIIASMQQCTDFFFLGTKQVPMARVGKNYSTEQNPNGDPMGLYWLQGLHMIHCAFNSLWMGQTIQPDWDMFQSDHACAKFHAASRAICGGPVYLSDSLGRHDFDLVRKLAFPDGTIPRCLHFALPTRHGLFSNPLFDGRTLFKIWNLNKFGGVVGAFNCQGAGWNEQTRTFRGHSQCYKPVSGSIHIRDIEWDQKEETAEMGASEEYAVYLNQAEELLLLSKKWDSIDITLQPSSFEILITFLPIKILGRPGIKFAPIGLTNMFNGGGAFREVEYDEAAGVRMKTKGCGKFLAYSSARPKTGRLNGIEVGFEWSGDGKLTMDVPWNEDDGGICGIDLAF
ncbi:hypothetical protein H6P81_002320 [Aristolochia fimbriata]|uniref:Stachyose synthase n=1 Tax=Aristolochia fimbriata TaxID=158543 RepID=A0AAV7FCN7_ARIFI|nr:hypothetical protein H6P81_002320 [Aristolochia fimbriata]